MKNLYIIDFKKSLTPSVWGSIISQERRYRRIRAFINEAHPNYKIHLVGDEHGEMIHQPNCPDICFVHFRDFSDILFTTDDLVIFWSGESPIQKGNKPTSRREIAQMVNWYKAMMCAHRNNARIHVLMEDWNSRMMTPQYWLGFTETQNMFSEFLSDPVLNWELHIRKYGKIKINIISGATRPNVLRSEIWNDIDAYSNIESIEYIPTHMLSYPDFIKATDLSEHDSYVHYYNMQDAVDMWDKNDFVTQTAIKHLSPYMNGAYAMMSIEPIKSTGVDKRPQSLEYTAMPFPAEYHAMGNVITKNMGVVVIQNPLESKMGFIPSSLVEAMSSGTLAFIHESVFGTGKDLEEMGFSSYQIFGESRTYESLKACAEYIAENPSERKELIEEQYQLFGKSGWFNINKLRESIMFLIID